MNSLQRTALICLGFLLGVLAIYRYGFHKGWSERDVEMQLAIAAANEKSRKTEHELNQQINDVNNTLTEANNALEKESSALQRAIRAGRVRLPASSCVPAASSPAAPSGDRNQTRSEPDPATDQSSDADRATLAAIAEIVAQADRNTAQLNACIDAYNQMRDKLNGHR